MDENEVYEINGKEASDAFEEEEEEETAKSISGSSSGLDYAGETEFESKDEMEVVEGGEEDCDIDTDVKGEVDATKEDDSEVKTEDESETEHETDLDKGLERDFASSYVQINDDDDCDDDKEEKDEVVDTELLSINKQLLLINTEMADIKEVMNRYHRNSVDVLSQIRQELQFANIMREELVDHRRDMYSKIVLPVLRDIINMRNDITRVVATRRDENNSTHISDLNSYAEWAGRILQRNGVEIYTVSQYDDFDPELHETFPGGEVTTHDESLDKKVAAALSDGYRYSGTIISCALVQYYKYIQSDDKEQSVTNDIIIEMEETNNG